MVWDLTNIEWPCKHCLLQTIPKRINTEDQREILSLLCKVHELEIENTETQSACLLREFQIKRKDMVILKFRQHQNLCDQIIQRQKQIMEGKVDVSTWKFTFNIQIFV